MIDKLKRWNPRHVLVDVVLIVASFYVSLYLRLDWQGMQPSLPLLNRCIALFVVLRLGIFTFFGVYDIVWRYLAMKDAVTVVKAVAVSSTLVIAASYLIDVERLPRTLFLIEPLLTTALLLGIRFTRRLAYEYTGGRAIRKGGRRALIVGAGTNGRMLVTRLNTDSDLGFKLIGFVDDDPQKIGRFIAGAKVFGGRNQLASLIREAGIEEVIVAITRPSGELLRDVAQACYAARVKPRLLNAIASGGGMTKIESFRSLELSDLLNRPRRDIDIAPIRSLLAGKRVLVTGAGGSIGSELARQILSFAPGRLVLLDHGEFNLYQIDQELRKFTTDSDLVTPILADIKDESTLRHLFDVYRPELVFHAAAYKHVHLVENSAHASILNNVLGTRNLVDLSLEFGVERFVLISTDKAVNPVGVMGATKRICELLIAEAGRESGRRYCAVRFGNVLGSSGSLIPMLMDQIDRGQPLTITHPDMSRYFMLVSEAVSLVLRAATIAAPGDITLLNMGEPVKIVDVARSLLSLTGKTEEECPVVFTGLRPGEKLFEELYLCGNESKTEDPDVLVLPRGDRRRDVASATIDLGAHIEQLLRLARAGSPEAVPQLHALVRGDFIRPADEERGRRTGRRPEEIPPPAIN